MPLKTVTATLLLGVALGFVVGHSSSTSKKVTGDEEISSSTSAQPSGTSISSRRVSPRTAQKPGPEKAHHLTMLNPILYDDDLDLLTLSRILAEIGNLGALEVLQILEDPSILGSESYFIEEIRTSALIRLLELSGPRAFTHLEKPAFDEFTHDTESISQGFGLWTLSHPDLARDWFEKLVGDVDHLEEKKPGLYQLLEDQSLFAALIKNYEKARTGKAQELLAILPDEESREFFHELIAEAQVDHQHSPDVLKEFLFEGSETHRELAIRKLMKIEPAFSRSWISEQVSSPNKDDLVTEAASDYLSEELTAGSQWYLKQELSTPKARSTRLHSLVDTHLNNSHSLESTVNWLESQPDNSERDAAEARIAQQNLHSRNFEEGVAWIAGISDPALQRSVIREILPNEIPTSNIVIPGIPAEAPQSVTQIHNNPNRINSDFISTVDRVFIPGIPPNYSEIDQAKFREVAQAAGLLPQNQEAQAQE